MTPRMLFSVLDREVVVTDLSSGSVLWAGRPLGRAVLQLVQMPDGFRAVVLLDYYGSPHDDRENLVAIDESGQILWRAELPTASSTDAFTEFELVEEGISAFSWSGHRVLIDPCTGDTLDDDFAK